MDATAISFLVAALVAAGLAAAAQSTRLVVASALLFTGWCVSFIIRHILFPIWPLVFDPDVIKWDDPLVGLLNFIAFNLLACRFPDEVRARVPRPNWAILCAVGELYLFVFIYAEPDEERRSLAIQGIYGLQILTIAAVSIRLAVSRQGSANRSELERK